MIKISYLNNREYEKGAQFMFNSYFKYLENSNNSVIFAHNLGGFDGIFIYKYLADYLKSNSINIGTVMDKSSRFITINYTPKRVGN